jgi:hypothetical protein
MELWKTDWEESVGPKLQLGYPHHSTKPNRQHSINPVAQQAAVTVQRARLWLAKLHFSASNLRSAAGRRAVVCDGAGHSNTTASLPSSVVWRACVDTLRGVRQLQSGEPSALQSASATAPRRHPESSLLSFSVRAPRVPAFVPRPRCVAGPLPLSVVRGQPLATPPRPSRLQFAAPVT